jgi:hypothetical protein
MSADRRNIIKKSLLKTGVNIGIPRLISNLTHEDKKFRHVAYEALKEFSGLDYGTEPDKWEEWWKDNEWEYAPQTAAAEPAQRAGETAGTETATIPPPQPPATASPAPKPAVPKISAPEQIAKQVYSQPAAVSSAYSKDLSPVQILPPQPAPHAITPPPPPPLAGKVSVRPAAAPKPAPEPEPKNDVPGLDALEAALPGDGMGDMQPAAERIRSAELPHEAGDAGFAADKKDAAPDLQNLMDELDRLAGPDSPPPPPDEQNGEFDTKIYTPEESRAVQSEKAEPKPQEKEPAAEPRRPKEAQDRIPSSAAKTEQIRPMRPAPAAPSHSSAWKTQTPASSSKSFAAPPPPPTGLEPTSPDIELPSLTREEEQKVKESVDWLEILGPREALPQLLEHVDHPNHFKQKKVLAILHRLTGWAFGPNRRAWEQWWETNKNLTFPEMREHAKGGSFKK